MVQTKHPQTYWETSRVILGHQYELVGAIEYAGCLGVQSPGKHAGSPEG